MAIPSIQDEDTIIRCTGWGRANGGGRGDRGGRIGVGRQGEELLATRQYAIMVRPRG